MTSLQPPVTSSKALMLTATFALGAYASVPRQPYSAAEAQVAEVAGIPNARAFADASVGTLAAMMAAPEAHARPFAYLALSGGGGDGAYGAGVLKGWSDAGTRPEFSLVSGVSTGALTAPFAFLGPAYDSVLEEIYTSGVANSLVDLLQFSGERFGGRYPSRTGWGF